MRKRMWLIIGSVFCVVAIVGYCAFYDYLPPRTPLKIARVQSGLDIPYKMQVLDFKEEYSFNGEGYVYVLLKIDEKTKVKIVQECKEKNYKSLTIRNLITDKLVDPEMKEYGFNINGKNIASLTEGYYRLNNNLQKMDFSITVLDTNKKELIVYISFP